MQKKISIWIIEILCISQFSNDFFPNVLRIICCCVASLHVELNLVCLVWLQASQAPPPPPTPASAEDRRAQLREIEMKVMAYQDELESGKAASKPGWTISEQVEQFRKKLMRKTTSAAASDRTPTAPASSIATPPPPPSLGLVSGGYGSGKTPKQHV